MKTLKMLALLGIVAAFTVINAKAQSGVIKGDFVFEVVDQPWPCVNDVVSGNITGEYMIMPHLYMMRNFKDELTGISGNVYEITQNWRGNPFTPGNENAITFGSNVEVRLDGKLVVQTHWTYHLTINANGEVTVELDNAFDHCH